MKIVVATAPVQPDSAALEAALELRAAAGAGEVVAVLLGGAHEREGLLSALAMGADRGLHVVHDAPHELDPIATARALAGSIGRESPDLVLCGTGATGVALAAFLGLPRVAGVSRIDSDPPAPTATVERRLEGGLVEMLEVRLPAVLTVQPGAYKPRYATLRAVREAFSKPVEVLIPEPADFDTGARVVSVSRAPQGARAQMIDGSVPEIAERIAAIIRSDVA